MSEEPPYLGLAVVIDDLAENRTLFDAVLRAVHFDVLSAANGAEGVALIETGIEVERIPTIIFLDMMMPEMGGLECARQIRTLGYQGPLLAFSADVSSKTKKSAIEAGVNQYFMKSTFNKDLASALILQHCGIDVTMPWR